MTRRRRRIALVSAIIVAAEAASSTTTTQVDDPAVSDKSCIWHDLAHRSDSLVHQHLQRKHVAGLKVTGAQLIGSCYQGYSLNGCVNSNYTSDRTGVSNQFLPTAPWCLNCCGNPTATGTDETWDLLCPLPLLQRTMIVNDIGKKFVFAKRATVTDESIVSCQYPTRNKSLFLAGYVLTLNVTEHSENSGWQFWVGVDSCSVTAVESDVVPLTFVERIRMVSVSPPYTPSPLWYLLLAAVLITTAFAAWLAYKGIYKRERCINCASRLVVVHSLCVMCIVCGCRLHAPPPKVFCAETYEAELKRKAEEEAADDSDDA
ncbi:Aste57867_9539 [Aphanomyces stellatus]|uniref:Aste57867_9539 protein n=1 Tax=Aphanomyces stellatus TaxID=120398 RepID=A0A485KNN1_9STRA|nr:hypothetical protein As57867_009502 [Aphanomyces stellatus]VFT86418.1 Aste57867_9539 [Aphanomyces stellatus]